MTTNLERDLKAILNEKATKLKPENLKKDITCLGITGTMESGIDTSDATATANDIVNPTTAYVKDKKIVGNIMVTSKTLDPELKRLNDVSTTDTNYRIRAANYEYGIAIIDTLNTNTSGGATASVNFGKFSNGIISVLDKTLGPTDFGFSDSATITGVDLRKSLSKENTLLIACCIVDSSNIYLATCNYDVTTNLISDTHVSSNYISGKGTKYDTVRPYIHPLHDFVTLAYYGFIGYCFLTEEYTIITLKSQNGSTQGGVVLSYNSDYNKGILSFGSITSTSYLIDYNFTTNTITLQTLSGVTDKLCFVENMVFGMSDSGNYNIYSLNGSTLVTVFTNKYSFGVNKPNSVQMIALGNYIFWYDIDRTYRLILNLSDYSLTVSPIAGGAPIKNCWETQNFMDFVNVNEGKYHLYASNNENIIYVHTVEGTEVTDTITRNGSTLYNTYTDTATTADIIDGKTAHSSSGKIIGTMPNNGALEYTPSEQEQTIPAGYTSGGTVKAIDYSDTLTPTEYTTALDTAKEILGGKHIMTYVSDGLIAHYILSENTNNSIDGSMNLTNSGLTFVDNTCYNSSTSNIASTTALSDIDYNNFTISIYAKSTDTDLASKEHAMLFGFFGTSTNTSCALKAYYGKLGIERFMNNNIVSTYKINQNEWHRYTAVVSNGTVTLYVDTEQVLQTSIGASAPTSLGLMNYTNQIRMGWIGYTSNALIYNRALTSEEIIQNYSVDKEVTE